MNTRPTPPTHPAYPAPGATAEPTAEAAIRSRDIYIGQLETHANAECKSLGRRNKAIGGLLVLCLAIVIILGFGQDKNGIDSQKLLSLNGEVNQLTNAKIALEKELDTIKADKINADNAVKTAVADKAKADEAVKKAEAEKVKAETVVTEAKEKALKAESDAKEAKADLTKVQSDLQLANGGKTVAENQKAEAEKKVSEIRDQLQMAKDQIAALKAAHAPAQVIVSTPAPTSSSATVVSASVTGSRDIQLPTLRSNEAPLQGKHVGAPGASMRDFLEYEASVAAGQAKADPTHAGILGEYAQAFLALADGKKLSDRQRTLMERVIANKMARESGQIDGKQLRLALESSPR